MKKIYELTKESKDLVNIISSIIVETNFESGDNDRSYYRNIDNLIEKIKEQETNIDKKYLDLSIAHELYLSVPEELLNEIQGFRIRGFLAECASKTYTRRVRSSSQYQWGGNWTFETKNKTPKEENPRYCTALRVNEDDLYFLDWKIDVLGDRSYKFDPSEYNIRNIYIDRMMAED